MRRDARSTGRDVLRDLVEAARADRPEPGARARAIAFAGEASRRSPWSPALRAGGAVAVAIGLLLASGSSPFAGPSGVAGASGAAPAACVPGIETPRCGSPLPGGGDTDGWPANGGSSSGGGRVPSSSG